MDFSFFYRYQKGGKPYDGKSMRSKGRTTEDNDNEDRMSVVGNQDEANKIVAGSKNEYFRLKDSMKSSDLKSAVQRDFAAQCVIDNSKTVVTVDKREINKHWYEASKGAYHYMPQSLKVHIDKNFANCDKRQKDNVNGIREQKTYLLCLYSILTETIGSDDNIAKFEGKNKDLKQDKYAPETYDDLLSALFEFKNVSARQFLLAVSGLRHHEHGFDSKKNYRFTIHMTHNQKSQSIGTNLRDISYGLIMHRKISENKKDDEMVFPVVDMQSFKGESRAIQEKSRKISMQQREMEKLLEEVEWKKKEEQWNYEYVETEYMRAVENGTLKFDEKFEMYCNPDGSRKETRRTSIMSGVTWGQQNTGEPQKRISEWLPREEQPSSSNGWTNYNDNNAVQNGMPHGMPQPNLPTIEETKKSVTIVGDGNDRETAVPMEIDNTPKRTRENEDGEKPKRTRSEEIEREQKEGESGEKTTKSEGKKDEKQSWNFPVPRSELEELQKAYEKKNKEENEK